MRDRGTFLPTDRVDLFLLLALRRLLDLAPPLLLSALAPIRLARGSVASTECILMSRDAKR